MTVTSQIKNIVPNSVKKLYHDLRYSLQPKYVLTESLYVGTKKNYRSAIPARIYFNKATPLCHLMKRYGSDKGLYSGFSRHNYTTVYNALFSPMKDRAKRVFELGIGTTNTNITSHMGATGIPGASLRAWAEYFFNAEIFSADIDKDILFQTNRITTFYCDQTDITSIKQLWSQPVLLMPFDIIIDDALHEFEANSLFLEASLDKLKPGGFYIIEDVLTSALPRWKHHVAEMMRSKPEFNAVIIQLPNRYNNWDNNLVIFEKLS